MFYSRPKTFEIKGPKTQWRRTFYCIKNSTTPTAHTFNSLSTNTNTSTNTTTTNTNTHHNQPFLDNEHTPCTKTAPAAPKTTPTAPLTAVKWKQIYIYTDRYIYYTLYIYVCIPRCFGVLRVLLFWLSFSPRSAYSQTSFYQSSKLSSSTTLLCYISLSMCVCVCVCVCVRVCVFECVLGWCF